MGFDPSAPFDVVAAPQAQPSGGFDPSAPFEVAPPAAAPTPQAPGRMEAVGRGLLQGASMGFSDELSGAIDALFTKKTYQQGRDEARANNAAAQQAHPYLYGGSELAGGVAGALVPGAALAKGAALAGEGTALARGLGGAAKLAGLATGAAPEGVGLANVAARSALAGGVAGLGGSNAGTLAGAAKDVGVGAAAGGVVGGVLHGIGSKIAANAPESYAHDLNADLFKASNPKDYKPAIRVQQANPEQHAAMIYDQDFKKVQTLARAGKVEDAAEAADAFVDKASANRLSNYAVAEKNYKADPGAVVQRMQQEASVASSHFHNDEAKAIADAAQTVRNHFETVNVNDLRAGDTADADALAKLKPYLSDRETITKAEFHDAALQLAKKENGAAGAGDIPPDVFHAIENLPFKFDPNAHISLVELRKVATQAQNQTASTLGSIKETEHFRIQQSVDNAINNALDSHLDAAARTSPEAAKAVEKIRWDNKVISMGLSARKGLQQRMEKAALGDKGVTLADKLVKAGDSVKHSLPIALGAAAISHNPLYAATALLPPALKVVGKATRAGNDQLARILHAASIGNPMATKWVAALRATPAGAARISGLLGAQPRDNLSQ